MNYGNFAEPKMDCACVPVPVESLTDMMIETSAIAADVLGMVHRIKAHMFGMGSPCCEKEADPKCFREELMKTRCELLKTARELADVCSMLGV